MPNILIIRRPACYVEAQGQPNISWNLHIVNCSCSSTFENNFRLSENFKGGSWTINKCFDNEYAIFEIL